MEHTEQDATNIKHDFLEGLNSFIYKNDPSNVEPFHVNLLSLGVKTNFALRQTSDLINI